MASVGEQAATATTTAAPAGEAAGAPKPPVKPGEQTRTIKRPGETFATEKQVIRTGEMYEGAPLPNKEVVISSEINESLYNFVCDYDDTTQRLKGQSTEYQPTQRDLALAELRKVLDKRVKPILDNREKLKSGQVTDAAERIKLQEQAKKDPYKDLFYNFTELSQSLWAVEDLLMQETASVSSVLPEGKVAVPSDKLPAKISAETKGERGVFGHVFKGSVEAGKSIAEVLFGKGGTKAKIQPKQIMEDGTAVTPYLSDRIDITDFDRWSSTAQQAEIIRLQNLRHEVYKAFGLRVDASDNILSLDPAIFDIDPESHQAETTLKFHHETINELRNILELEHEGKPLMKLAFADQIKVLLQAREQAASARVIGTGQAILAETQGKEVAENRDIADLAADAATREAGKKGTAEEIDAQTTAVEELKAKEADIREKITLLTSIEAQSGDTSLAQATSENQVAVALQKAKKKNYSGAIENFDKSIDSYNQRVSELKAEISKLKKIKKRTPEDEKGLRDSESELEQKNQEKTRIDTFRSELTQAEEAVIRSRNKFTTLTKTRQAIIDELGVTVEKRQNALQTKINAKTQAQTKLTLLTAEALEDQKTYARAERKLHAVITQDTNAIIEKVTTGGASLTSLSGEQTNDTFDPDIAYQEILDLLFHTGAETITREFQEQMLSRFELAFQTAKHYGIDLTTDADFQTLDTLRTGIRTKLRNGEDAKTEIESFQNTDNQKKAREILQKVLPQIRIHGRWQAAELMQKILLARAKDAREGFLLEPAPYSGKRPVEPISSAPPAAPAAPGNRPPPPPPPPPSGEGEAEAEIEPSGLPRIEVASTIINSPDHSDYSADCDVAHTFAQEKGGLIAAIDGVGVGGESSVKAAESVQTRLQTLTAEFPDDPPTITQAVDKLSELLLLSGIDIRRIQTETNDNQVDTTCSLGIICVSPDKKRRFLVTANVGDSRIYRFNTITKHADQLTQDHSLVQALVNAGTITSAEAFLHPNRNVVFRTVGGVKDRSKIDFTVVEINEGDIFIATSDGAHDNITPEAFPVVILDEMRKHFDETNFRTNLDGFTQGLAQRARNIMDGGRAPQAKNDDICIVALNSNIEPEAAARFRTRRLNATETETQTQTEAGGTFDERYARLEAEAETNGSVIDIIPGSDTQIVRQILISKMGLGENYIDEEILNRPVSETMMYVLNKDGIKITYAILKEENGTGYNIFQRVFLTQELCNNLPDKREDAESKSIFPDLINLVYNDSGEKDSGKITYLLNTTEGFTNQHYIEDNLTDHYDIFDLYSPETDPEFGSNTLKGTMTQWAIDNPGKASQIVRS